jgi:hypothetical protein
MSYKYAELRRITLDKLIQEHDEAAGHANVGINYYLTKSPAATPSGRPAPDAYLGDRLPPRDQRGGRRVAGGRRRALAPGGAQLLRFVPQRRQLASDGFIGGHVPNGGQSLDPFQRTPPASSTREIAFLPLSGSRS